MTTNVAATQLTGNLGESMADVAFQKIGWAPAVKIPQDIGDDLLTFARDQFRHDLSAPVLMQVKSSPTAYRQPSSTSHDGHPGWYFTEPDANHFDHWTRFGLPYLLILQDTTGEVSYWTHVTPSAIEGSGKGRKIFVPSAQRVDAEQAPALIDVATASRRTDLEGSVWSGHLDTLASSARLRTALVTPRLVAPHANREDDVLSYEEVVAVMLSDRSRALGHFVGGDKCPAVKDWATHTQWGWRFAAAVRSALAQGIADGLDEVHRSAPTPFERDACAVVAACTTFAEDPVTASIALLQSHDDSTVIDRAWLGVQRAHVLLEQGLAEDAAAVAAEALLGLDGHDGDPAISAIRGGAAAVLYAASAVGDGDLSGTISAQDNVGAWWRAQAVSNALGTALDDRFQGWARGAPAQVAAAYGELNKARANAAFSTAWASWRRLSAQMAQLVLTASPDHQDVSRAITCLVDTGHKEDATAAANRIWEQGPVTALSATVSTLARRIWSPRAEGPTLGVLGKAGDLLTTEEADAVVDRLLESLRQGDVREFAGGWSDRWHEVEPALARVLRAAGPTSHIKVAELVADRFGDGSSVAHALMAAARSLDLGSLDQVLVDRMREAAGARDDGLRLYLLETLAQTDPEAVQALHALDREGVPNTWRSLIIVDAAQPQHWERLGASASAVVAQRVRDATVTDGQRSFAYSSVDHLHDLCAAALHTGNPQWWDVVLNALEAGVLPAAQLTRTVTTLAANFAAIPPRPAARLRAAVMDLTAFDADGTGPFEGARVAAVVAAGVLSESEVLDLVVTHRQGGDTASFVRALGLWRSPHARSLLIALTTDAEPALRSHALYALVQSTAGQPELDEVATVVVAAVRLDDGCALPLAAAHAFTDFPDPAIEEFGQMLASHRSALVRAAVQP